MEVIRKIQTVKNGQICLDIPSLSGQQVEVIVLTTTPFQWDSTKRKKSLRGCLREYAKPEMISHEDQAWEEAIG